MRDANIVLQGHDFSCGAASLATLMRYYFGDPVTEADVLNDILSHLSEEELAVRRKDGLSLLDLQQAAERMGYQAASVQLELDALSKLRGPVLVHLERDGYRHFAIFRGVRGDRVFLADPSRGNVRQLAASFAQDWTGLSLVLGKEGFGLPAKHALAVDDSPTPYPEQRAVRGLIMHRH